MAEEQKAKNLYKALINDQRSIFYAADRIMKDLIQKVKTSLYPKDKVFVNICTEISSESSRKHVVLNENPPLNTPFIEKEKMLIGARFAVLVVLLKRYRQILQTFDSWVDQQPIQNIVFCLLICSFV